MLQYLGTIELDFEQLYGLFGQFINGIMQIRVVGGGSSPGRIFDQIGFDALKDELFRKLVIAKLCYPAGKLKTTGHLRRYDLYETDGDKIYRCLDKLYKTQKRAVQQISYAHTLKVLCGDISVVFYDVTTLCFEIRKRINYVKRAFQRMAGFRTLGLFWACRQARMAIHWSMRFTKAINLKAAPCFPWLNFLSAGTN